MYWENLFEIKVKNFKSLKDISLKIKPITILVGPNGSGKSSIISAVKLLVQNISSPSFNTMKFPSDSNSDHIGYRDIVFQNDLDLELSIELRHEFKEYDYDKITDSDKYSVTTKFNSTNDGSLSSILIKDLNDNTFFEMYPRGKKYVNSSQAAKICEDLLGIGDNNDLSKQKGDSREEFQDTLLIDLDLNNLSLFDTMTGLGRGYPNENINIGRKISLFENKRFDDNLNNFYRCWDILPFFNTYDEVRQSYQQFIFNKMREFHQYKDDFKKFIFRYYQRIPQLCGLIKNAPFIDPIRNKPKYRYKLENGKFRYNDYYGILNLWDEANNEWYPYQSLTDLRRHVNDTLQTLGIAKKFDIKKEGEFGYATLELENGINFNLAEANSGTIQILPIIFNSYLAGYTYEIYGLGGVFGSNLLFIEQPELHLHPKLQSQLAEFISKGLNTFIIETHSEHFIRKLQIQVAKNPNFKKMLAIYYLDNSSGDTKIKEMEILDNGFFKEPWPDGFFDDSYKLTKELLRANKN